MPIIRDILYGAAQQGANLQAMCRRLNIQASDLSRSDMICNFKTSYTAWEIALEDTGDEMLGLRLGTTTTPAILGIVGHLIQSSATLSDAFRQVCTFSAVATDMFRYAMYERDDQTVLTFSPAPSWSRVSPRTARQALDQAMAGCLHVFLLLAGRQIQPRAVTFSYPRPPQPSRYTQVFGPDIRFNAKANTLVFSQPDMQWQLPQHDRSLFATFEKLARTQLRKRRAKRTFRDDVLQCMRFDFSAQVPSLKTMAAHMNLSARTFQRKLALEDVQYRDIADEVSREIATSLMATPNMHISDIARLMGYSEPSAFRRAVKRWTKSTPGKLMRTLRSNRTHVDH